MPKGIYPRRVKCYIGTQPLGQSYRLIPLTQEQNAIVDAEDFKWLSQWNWCASWSDHVESFYAIRSVIVDGRRTTIAMHQVILGCNASEQGDHKNHDTLDNRKQNLRKCAHLQNMHNQRLHRDNTSGYKGVSWHRRVCKWQASIKLNGKSKFLGFFTSSELAARAYDMAVREYRGEFARYNFYPSLAP